MVGDATAWDLVVPVSGSTLVLWTVLPFTLRHRDSTSARRPSDFS